LRLRRSLASRGPCTSLDSVHFVDSFQFRSNLVGVVPPHEKGLSTPKDSLRLRRSLASRGPCTSLDSVHSVDSLQFRSNLVGEDPPHEKGLSTNPLGCH